MKKLLPLFFAILLLGACKNKCKDYFCPATMECIDGRCKNMDGSCPLGFEGRDCDIRSNEKFAGRYDVDYFGTGSLSATEGTTIAHVKLVNQSPNKIRMDVKLILLADLMGQSSEVPLTISVEGEVKENEFHVPNTKIQTSIDVQGFPLPVEFNFMVDGKKEGEDVLNSVLILQGTISGRVFMSGKKE